MKELSIQIDEERQQVNDQKDQVRTWQGGGSVALLLLGEPCPNSQMRLGKDSIPSS